MVASGYLTKLETVTVAGVSYQLRSLLDRQQFHDPDGIAEARGIVSAAWPIFGLVWPAGLILAEIMSEYAVDRLRVLELGSGLGLASLIASQRGAVMTASDYHPLAQAFMDENARLNNMHTVAFEACNWHVPQTELGVFDLIIGSDILYEPNHAQLLVAFIHAHAKPTTKIMMVDANRGHHAQFSKGMHHNGYVCQLRQVSDAQKAEHKFKGKVLCYEQMVGFA